MTVRVPMARWFAVPVAACLLAGSMVRLQAGPPTDLDAFMARVLARRDENWKKLQQYILDERETVDVLGPGRTRLFGRAREFTWFQRDDRFIRSPLRFDGVALGDRERREYERDWLQREGERSDGRAKTPPRDAPRGDAAGLEDVVREGREPSFVSAAYFLKFVFEPGRYALVGPETFEGRRVLVVEYYPTRLFDDDGEARRDEADSRVDRGMNKVALVTLWIEPTAHQIVQYTFDNVGFDFLPGRSLVRVDTARASMRMTEAFPGVWLPRDVKAHVAMMLAPGAFEMRYDIAYHDYRQADVKVQIR